MLCVNYTSIKLGGKRKCGIGIQCNSIQPSKRRKFCHILSLDETWDHYAKWNKSQKDKSWGDLQDGRRVRRGDHLPPHKYIRNNLHVEILLQNTYWTLAEDLRLPKRQETPHVPGKGKRKKKKQRQKNRDGTCTSGRELWRWKSFHTLGSSFTGGDRGWQGGKLWSHRGECSNRGAEGKSERFPYRGSVPTSTHQPERLVCSSARVGGGWELRLRVRRSDPRERTKVGCVNTA